MPLPKNPALHWSVTDNNPDENRAARWQNFAEEFCEYFAGQEEQGAENGRRHYQIAFGFKTKRRAKFIKDQLEAEDLHIEVSRDPNKAWEYCRKGDSRIDGGWSYQKGEGPIGQGNRTDLDHLRVAAEGGGIKECFRVDFKSTVRYWRGIERYIDSALDGLKRDFKTEVYVFYGRPGLGKSSLCHAIERSHGGALHVKLVSSKWWDHYEPLVHTGVLIDDFKGTLPYSQLLAIMDRGECYIEVKGKVVPFLAKRLYITSNCLPEDWYEEKIMNKEAVFRRIDFYWNGRFQDEGLEPVPVPRLPVILGGNLEPRDVPWAYHGAGVWDVNSDIEITE